MQDNIGNRRVVRYPTGSAGNYPRRLFRPMIYKKCSPDLVRVCLLFAVALTLAVPASAEWKEKVLYSFQGGANNGSVPVGGVVFDQLGNLYGVTSDGGGVYKLSPPTHKGGSWTESVLYVFQGNSKGDGASPSGGLIIDSVGNLYGVTAYGGTGNCVLLGISVGCGTVYKLSPPKQKGGAWKETILYSFPTADEGYFPNGDLVFDSAGNLYGATIFGGGKGTSCDKFYGGNCGAVFELSPPKTKGGNWTEEMLHAFAGGTAGKKFGDGAYPYGGLVFDAKGVIYGTTSFGGNESGVCQGGNGFSGCGTVFTLKPPTQGSGAWTERILHRFADANDGAGPTGSLTFDAKGHLYGTAGGGIQQDGVVFRLTRKVNGNWAEVVIHAFTDNAHGRGPSGPVTFDSVGNLYGVAGWGQYFAGVVYRLAPKSGRTSWSYSLPYEFNGAPDGAGPEAGLILDRVGNLYGTTQGGGTGQACQGGCGTVFEVSP
jgi:uncharacterized protein YceK